MCERECTCGCGCGCDMVKGRSKVEEMRGKEIRKEWKVRRERGL